MQIVTSVRAYQWPYTLYVFREAAGRNGAKTLNETTNKGNNIFSGAIYVVRFEKCMHGTFLLLLINTCKDYTHLLYHQNFFYILNHLG